MESYRRIVIQCLNAEDDSFSLHDLGALGVEIISEQTFAAFLPPDEAVIARITAYCEENNWTFTLSDDLANQNWVQQCAEIWQPISVGRLKIHPLVEPAAHQTKGKDTIYIIPGEGFGTGHHPSTRLAMAHIQGLHESQLTSVLDFGTGNGILAIAAALTLPKASIEAIDNDASAIANAKEIVELNDLSARIVLSVSSIEATKGFYDLIIANIYAEVLCHYRDAMSSRLRSGGHLILAGIMNSRAEMIRECFCEPDWAIIRETEEAGWNSFHLKKSGA